jgi:hypothetical protein
MRSLAQMPASRLQNGAASYLQSMKHYANPANIVLDASWFKTNEQTLSDATELTDTIRLISTCIANQFPAGGFIDDNMKLIDVPLTKDLNKYLTNWDTRCVSRENVPQLLKTFCCEGGR